MKYTKAQATAKLKALESIGKLSKAIYSESVNVSTFKHLEKSIHNMYKELNEPDDNIYIRPANNSSDASLMYIVQMLSQAVTFEYNNEKHWIKLLKEYFSL